MYFMDGGCIVISWRKIEQGQCNGVLTSDTRLTGSYNFFPYRLYSILFYIVLFAGVIRWNVTDMERDMESNRIESNALDVVCLYSPVQAPMVVVCLRIYACTIDSIGIQATEGGELRASRRGSSCRSCYHCHCHCHCHCHAV